MEGGRPRPLARGGNPESVFEPLIGRNTEENIGKKTGQKKVLFSFSSLRLRAFAGNRRIRFQQFSATKRTRSRKKSPANPILFFAHFRASSWPIFLDSFRRLASCLIVLPNVKISFPS